MPKREDHTKIEDGKIINKTNLERKNANRAQRGKRRGGNQKQRFRKTVQKKNNEERKKYIMGVVWGRSREVGETRRI